MAGGPTNNDNKQPRTRINGDINAREIRVIASDGSQLGILQTDKALRMAEEQELDLVEIAPQAQPPVCKIMDFGKFKYEQQKKDKLLRKKQQVILVKEVRFHPNIDTHDFDFKLRHARQFLLDGNKVKASVVFRGRQMAHQEFGVELIRRFREQLEDIALVEREPLMEGRSLIAIFAPDKKKIKAVTGKSDDTADE
ncbi:MAG: translation initiation factor IF-3 [Ignavibacteriae bacterium]|nr:translation initiation factor IF-3 [Ignavibacteriota bacterium]